MLYRILYRMKVTALIPDQIVKEVSNYAKGKNLTESLVTALKEWLSLKKISKLNKKVKTQPLDFQKSFSAAKIRSINRKR